MYMIMNLTADVTLNEGMTCIVVIDNYRINKVF